ncbi:MAG: signal peptidase I [archaeon]
MKREGIKKYWKKFWHLLWKDDSLKGWIFSVIFLIILIKFIFLPGLSFITGTDFPLAIVESCSMYHKGNFFSTFNSWWERHEPKYESYDITKEQFSEFSMRRGFSKGDILFLIKANPEKLKIGDIILFEAGQKNPVIHRIIKIEKEGDKYFFSTIGDNNPGQLSVEKQISEDKLIGKAVFRITPFVGWGKLVFFEHTRTISERGFCKEN